MVGSHRDPIYVLLLEAAHHPSSTPGDLIEGEGLMRHLAPLQRGTRLHLVHPQSSLHQGQDLPSMERGSHHARGQPAQTKPP
jgi:hypothetical protein